MSEKSEPFPLPSDASPERPRVEHESPEANGPAEIDDLALARRAAMGDGQAFHTLVDRHSERLYGLAMMLVQNRADAEDVLQETLAGAYQGLNGFRERASVKTWLTQILVRQAARLRRDRRRRRMEAIEVAGPQMAIEGDQAQIGRSFDLHAALGQLSSEHREVLVLREFEHLSYEEMAAALGVPRGTVESRLHRARGELRERLKMYLPSAT